MGQKVIFKKIYTQNLEFAEKGGKMPMLGTLARVLNFG